MSQHSHPSNINRDYIRLLQVMRRFVKEEFAVTIRMTQEDAVEQLLYHAGISRNHVLREMALELRDFTADEQAVPHAGSGGDEAVRYYRGATVAADNADGQPERPGRAKRVYRGQVIE